MLIMLDSISNSSLEILVLVMSILLTIAVVALIITLLKLKKQSVNTDLATQIDDAEGIEDEDKEMLKSVFEFGDMITREIMVPRTDMMTLDSTETYAEAMKLFCRSGFSRIPVLGESADEVVGVAYFKDLIEELYIKNHSENSKISEILREALFVPESKPVDDLFRMLQETRQHIAVVVDEYGGVAGLITLEDTIEEIVGELYDEHDEFEEDENEIIRNDEGEVVEGVFPSRFLISDVEELFGVEIEHDDVDTILGLLTKLIGKVAIRGSNAQIAGLTFEATAVSGRRKRVAKIRVSRML